MQKSLLIQRMYLFEERFYRGLMKIYATLRNVPEQNTVVYLHLSFSSV